MRGRLFANQIVANWLN